MLKTGAVVRRMGHWPEELEAFELFKGQESWPSAQVLASWRAEVDEDVDFLIEAPAVLWEGGRQGLQAPLEPLEAALAVFERVAAAQVLLESPVVVLRPPSSFTPSDRNIRRLVAFLEAIAAPGRRVVFVPSGLWEAEHLREPAERGLVHLAMTPEEARSRQDWDWVYLRVSGLGRAHMGVEDLVDVAELCRRGRAGYCIFDLGRDSENRAALRRLRGLLESR